MIGAAAKKLWAVLWRLLLFCASWGLLQSPVVLLLQHTQGDLHAPHNLWRWVLVEAIGCISLLVACWGMARFADHRTLKSFGFSTEHIIRDSLVGWTFGLSMIACCVLVLLTGGWAVIEPHGHFTAVALLISFPAILINAATQEILVRGYILQTIQTHGGTWAAVFVSALIFSVIHAGATHGMALLPPMNLLIMGIVFALAYLRTGNLWLPIAMHAAWNYALGPVLGVAVSAQDLSSGWHVLEISAPEWIGGGVFGIEGGIVVTVVILAALLFFVSRGKQAWWW
jgi:uncharacterized protein